MVKRHREVPAAPVVPPQRGEQAEIVIGDRFGRDSVLLRLVGDPSKALLFAVNDGVCIFPFPCSHVGLLFKRTNSLSAEPASWLLLPMQRAPTGG